MSDILANDLDRCSSETIMDVLKVVILFLVDAPVTCWLAIDSRLVVVSIEKSFVGLYSLRLGWMGISTSREDCTIAVLHP